MLLLLLLLHARSVRAVMAPEGKGGGGGREVRRVIVVATRVTATRVFEGQRNMVKVTCADHVEETYMGPDLPVFL